MGTWSQERRARSPPRLRPLEALGEGMCWLQLTPHIMGTVKQNQAVALLVPKAWEKTSCQCSCGEQSRSCWAVQPLAVSAGCALWHSPCSLTAGFPFGVYIWAVSWDPWVFSATRAQITFFLSALGCALTAVATPVIPSHP